MRGMTEPIVIAPYDPAWPDAFAREQARLARACPGLAFEHIGSTSVPGLGAKPTVDIVGGIDQSADLNACIEPIVALGYEYVGRYEEEGDDWMPFRRYFKRGGRGAGSFHLHVVHRDSNFWQRQIGFRDLLRGNDASRQAYERLKRELAPRFTDGNEYADAKTDFIEGVLRRLAIAPTIRRIQPVDGATLRRVRISAISDSPDAFGSTLSETEETLTAAWDERARLRSSGAEEVTFFAEDNARPCGIVGGIRSGESPNAASLVSMWVAPTHRRTGVGHALVDNVISWAREAGYPQLDLWVTETNLPAISLYVSAGFTPAGRRQPLPSNPALHEQMYRLPLTNIDSPIS
jgi:GrpB-like predicted nucleotidyltransferase (UPF0157 family)/ribosomal protein S18 acetylase RimI-like enzyme